MNDEKLDVPGYAQRVFEKFEKLCQVNPAFAYCIEEIIDTNLRKGADYTHGGNPWSNFEEVAAAIGADVPIVLEMFIATKSARLKALRLENKGPQNESVADSLCDRAVYSILAQAYAREKANDHYDTRPVTQGAIALRAGQQVWAVVGNDAWVGIVDSFPEQNVVNVKIRMGNHNRIMEINWSHVFVTEQEINDFLGTTGRQGCESE